MPENNTTTKKVTKKVVNTTPEVDKTTPEVVKQQSSETKPGKVEVDSAVLEQVLGELKSVKQELAETKELQSQFEETASQDQIARIDKLRASGKLVKSVRLNMFDNQIVTSWRATEDDVYIEAGSGKEVCVQKMQLTFLDGEKKEIQQVEFARRKHQLDREVIKEGKNQEGSTLYTVMLEGGQELEIDSKYVN